MRMGRVVRSASIPSAHCVSAASSSSTLPFRAPRGERFVRDPRSESFVEPDVVPPLHRHEIAEPLMRDFVRDDARNLLARSERRALGIDEQQPFAEDDRPAVLHGAGREIGNRDGNRACRTGSGCRSSSLKKASCCSVASSAKAVSPSLSAVEQMRIGVPSGGACPADEIADNHARPGRSTSSAWWRTTPCACPIRAPGRLKPERRWRSPYRAASTISDSRTSP